MNLKIAASLLPALIFWYADRVWGATLGITIGFAAFCAVFWFCRDSGVIGVLALAGFLVTAASAVAGLLLNDEKAYLFSNPLGDFVAVVMHLGSAVVMRKPIVGLVARELAPTVAGHVPLAHPVYFWLTIAYAAYNLASGLLRMVMLETMSVGEFMIWSRVLTAIWGTGMVLVCAVLIYVVARRQVGGPLLPQYAFHFGARRIVP